MFVNRSTNHPYESLPEVFMLTSYNSQLPSSFSEAQKNILEELRDTEIKFKDFLLCISSARESIIYAIKSAEINISLSEYDTTAIFITFDEIANLSKKTSDLLSKILNSKNPVEVAKLLNEYLLQLPKYADAMYRGVVRYKLLIKAGDEIVTLIDDVTKNILSDPKFENLSFSSFCIMPVQRLPRLILMFTELCKQTTPRLAYYPALCRTLTQLKDDADKINGKIKDLESVILKEKTKELEITELLENILNVDVNDPSFVETRKNFTQLINLASELVIQSKVTIDKQNLEDNSRAQALITRKQRSLVRCATHFSVKYQQYTTLISTITGIYGKQNQEGNELPKRILMLLQESQLVFQTHYAQALQSEYDKQDIQCNLKIRLDVTVETTNMLAILGRQFSVCHRIDPKKPGIFEYVDDVNMPVLQFSQKGTYIELTIFNKFYLDDLEAVIFQLQDRLSYKETKAEISFESNDDKRNNVRDFVRIAGALISGGVYKVESNWHNELKRHARQFPDDLIYNIFKEMAKIKLKVPDPKLQKQSKFNLIQRLTNNRLIPVSVLDFEVDDNMLIVVSSQDPHLALPQISAAVNAGFSFYCKKYVKLAKNIAALPQPELLLSIKVPLSEAIISRLNQTLNKKHFVMMERMGSQHLTDVSSRRNLSVPDFLRAKKDMSADEKSETAKPPEKTSPPPRQYHSLNDLNKLTSTVTNINLNRTFTVIEKENHPEQILEHPKMSSDITIERKQTTVLAIAKKFEKAEVLNNSFNREYTPMRNERAKQTLQAPTSESEIVKRDPQKLNKLYK